MNRLNRNDVSGKMKHSLIIIIISSIIISIAAMGNAGLFEMKASGITGESGFIASRQIPANLTTSRVVQKTKTVNNALDTPAIYTKDNLAIEDHQSPVYQYGLFFMVTLVTGAFLFFIMLAMFFFSNLANHLHAVISRVSANTGKEMPVSAQGTSVDHFNAEKELKYTADREYYLLHSKGESPFLVNRSASERQEMEDLICLVDNIRSLMAEMTTAMVIIENSNEDSNSIIKLADKITFQTNLLALNAEIEAVRMDNYGYRFAAIADGVRQLAIRAADLAKDTNGLIKKKAKILQQNAAKHIIPEKMHLADRIA